MTFSAIPVVAFLQTGNEFRFPEPTVNDAYVLRSKKMAEALREFNRDWGTEFQELAKRIQEMQEALEVDEPDELPLVQQPSPMRQPVPKTLNPPWQVANRRQAAIKIKR